MTLKWWVDCRCADVLFVVVGGGLFKLIDFFCHVICHLKKSGTCLEVDSMI